MNNAECNPEQFRQCSENSLSDAANAIYQYWLEKRTPTRKGIHGEKIKEKIGRNELCPCGSGKKFKKCCLH